MSKIESNDNFDIFDPKSLTDSQQSYILLNYDKKSLIELTRYVTGDPKADGRHKTGKIIANFLATKGLEYQTTKFKKADEIVLTEEQEEFIRANVSNLKALEATRILFKNEKLTPLNREFKAVHNFMDKITPGINRNADAPVDGEYKSPNTIFQTMKIVNRFVPNSKKENEPIYKSAEKLTTQDERNLKALLSYMNISRYGYVANSYAKRMDREIFESTFTGMTYDKPDLLREEIEQYISLASEIVTTAQIDRHIQTLDQQIDDIISGNSEDKKLSMSLIEAINAARERLDKSKERQKKLISELSGSRADRMKGKLEANASILNLVVAWQDEKKRLEMIELAMRQKAAEKDEMQKISDMESVVALLGGITIDEVT